MLKHLFSLKPRANRVEFVFWALVLQLISYPFTFVSNYGTTYIVSGRLSLLSGIVILLGSFFLLAFSLISLWLYFALLVRRLHDLNCSGWWTLLIFLLLPLVMLFPTLPIGGIIGGAVMLWLMFKSGTPGDNKYGATAETCYYPKIFNTVSVFYVLAVILMVCLLAGQINSYKKLQTYNQLKVTQTQNF